MDGWIDGYTVDIFNLVARFLPFFQVHYMSFFPRCLMHLNPADLGNFLSGLDIRNCPGLFSILRRRKKRQVENKHFRLHSV